jgi:ribosomal protein S18 acetylase RimI-like enzyme
MAIFFWDSDLRIIKPDDASALARLMDVSYRGTIDHEGETLQQCKEEILATVNGKYGPFISKSSFAIYKDNKVVSACLITIWKEQPLIAFSMTDPEYQGKGFAKQLILKAIDELAKDSFKTLYLVVTDGNTAAQNLYHKIGFKELGEALPKQPPPDFKY